MLKFGGKYSKYLINPYPAKYMCPESGGLLFMSAAYIQVHVSLDFIMEAHTMNTDQTAPEGAV